MSDVNSFWNQFVQYNTAVFPFQWILASLALISILFIFISKKAIFSTVLKIVLTVSFIFVGLVFFMLYGASLLTKIFGIIFLIIGVLLLIDIFRNRIFFSVLDDKWKIVSTLFWVLIVFLAYPLTGIALGHHYPNMCFPVATPCPLTILAIALIGTTKKNISGNVIIILLLPWAILAIPKLFGMYGCYEDGFLVLSAVWGLALLRTRLKKD